MRNKFIAALSALLLLVAGLFTAQAAQAAQSEECEPKEAWTEEIEHPAVYETVHHDAEYATEYEYVKQVKGKIQYDADPRGGHVDWKPVIFDPKTFDWEVWSGGSTKWSETNTDVLESGPHGAVQATWTEPVKILGQWVNVDYRKVTTEFRYVPTGETRQGRVVAEAYDEQVLVTEAWTETIDHPAVTCPDDPEDPPTFVPTCTSVDGSWTFEDEAFDGDVLTLTVPGGWAEETFSLGWSGTLAEVGTVLDIDADPIQYVGLHIITSKGNIVFEEEPSYGGKLWSKTAWDGVSPGMGYAAFGTIEEFIELNGDVAVSDIVVLYTHPEASSTAVTSVTIGCTTFTWADVVPEDPEDPEAPVVPPAQPPTPVVTQPSFTG